ncbi:MAG: tRNA (N(6)-L-threonylcarbamoyladenosine(37)-C(2))-methylthiotransferase MtaB [Candidatus Sericytochromatia bacterium]|nr:tRNA (N(6)-L-threonylcarbamoyladenosine(37)-C(2))-methylthiotransferase MtaB [Candidatus Sericytochromatia bacterium]
MKTISFVTLGCRANQAENSEYHQSMLEAGWEVLDAESNSSEVYVINTCTVTNEAERQSRQTIKKYAKNNPNSKLIVTGCSSKYLENNKDITSIVSLFVPNLQKDKFVQRVYDHLGIEKDFNPLDSIPRLENTDTTRLNLKISDGCNWACSFCIIPRTRGKLRSLSEDDIVTKAKRAEEMGYKEIVLTAIQLGGYGKDLGRNGLEILIPRLLAETKIPRIRLSSIEPTDVSDDLIKELAKSDRICNQFHIPIQSGSDHILDLMKRRYSRDEYADRINTLRKYIPDLTLTTDIMVGFPQESEQDFADSCEFVQTLGFNKLHIFPYSDRQGTAASKMEGKISPEIIKERKKILATIDNKLHYDWMNRSIGTKKQILVEMPKDDSGVMQGMSKDYYKVSFNHKNIKRNDLIDVMIKGVDLDKLCLIGELI